MPLKKKEGEDHNFFHIINSSPNFSEFIYTLYFEYYFFNSH